MTGAEAIGSAVLLPALAWLAWVDLRSFRLPDRGTLPLIASGLLWSAWSAAAIPYDALAGAVLGYAVFAALGAVFYSLRGVEGLGLGDAKLLAAAGAWLGATQLPMLVLIATLGALLWAISRGATSSTRIAFGPWLCLGAAILWLVRVLF